MTLEITAVYTAFTQFSGESVDPEGSQREALCAALCAQCARQVENLVRPDLTEEQLALWTEPLAQLSAAEAFYQLLLAEEAVTPQSLTAGSLKLAGGSNSQKAQRLAAEKRRAVSPALVETDFYFGRMEKGEDNGPAE